MRNCGYVWGVLCVLIVLISTIYLLSPPEKANDTLILIQESAVPAMKSIESRDLPAIRMTDPDDPGLEKGKNRWNLALGAVETDMVERIVMLESGGESDLGQQAVTEVIFNRIYSELYPDTVYEVLSQTDCGVRQFSSWKNRNSQSAVPSERVKKNVRAVLNGETRILPFKTLYFSQKGENPEIQAVIGNHVFCNQSYADDSSLSIKNSP